ncbi:hypothetical protein [Streptomyces sp. GQFP]|uniref:hypothetical protein n=1 Tax=Streptomyces sp. GQFP TaxID=2907545 RepID=UPI001F457462|nr:hypothetical protein [Streptomyces sp. GQFP]UIX32457.1 hypothetical protein LUX31_21795 [Streptomyces sp. GQFP]
MNEFQEMPSVSSADSAPSVSSAASASSAHPVPSVHQLVFRWEGNHGRQGTGMKAVAHSCSAERAEQLGRELGPLLWVSGPGAARPSVVRTLSRDGEVLLARRWPTKDPYGRPSTISHVLVGAPGTLKTRQCLGLAYGGWGPRESAEQASGTLSTVECAQLDALARQRLPEMLGRLESVRRALILVAAEWLRDPAQRVSLLVEETSPPGWPDRDGAPLVYLGLFLLFGSWPGHEWSFATYDTVDTHPLRLTSVPRWEQDTGGSGPLARVVMGRTPANPQFEHRAAIHLVDHLLAHPDAAAGVPQLLENMSDGATLDWARRRDLLGRILNAEGRGGYPYEVRSRVNGSPAQRPFQESTDVDGDWDRLSVEPPLPEPPYPAPYLEPAPTVTPPQPRRTPDREPYGLHEELCDHRRGDLQQRTILEAMLRPLPDEVLLRELRSGELPPDALDLVLSELGDEERRRTRPLEMRHTLCAQVLHNNLYLTHHGQPGELTSRAALADRAADLFTWAVAPLARDDRYLLDLQELLARMCRDPHPTAGNWLRHTVIAPPNGEVPDLPPTVWQQILHVLLTRPNGPQPTTSHPSPATTPPPAPTAMTRLSDLMDKPGCVIGAALTVLFVLVTTVLILM